MWSVRNNNNNIINSNSNNNPRPNAEPEEEVPPRRRYLWDKTQHGAGSLWLSGFRDALYDGSVVRQPSHKAAEWNLDGALYDDSVRQEKEAVKKWLAEDAGRGVVRIHEARLNASQSTLVLCTLTTTTQQLCLKMGLSTNVLHYQLNGDVIRRMDPFDCPLALQNDYLKCIGFDKAKRIQEEGASADLADLIRFYAGKPYLDATFSRQTLCAVLPVRKQKGLLHPWSRRMCEISGTRLLLYPGTDKNLSPEVIYLIRGKAEESRGQRHHEFCLKVSGFTTNATALHQHPSAPPSPPQTSKTVYMAFENETDMLKWSRKCNKAIAKQPDVADLSNNHLEFLPENLFINDGLTKLNLRHNALKERPIEEDIYTIGWLDDLPRFTHLRSLNLANNELRNFPLAVCKIRTLVELNMASNKLEELPSLISDLSNLKALHLQANHLRDLPLEFRHLKQLKLLVLAFNHFTAIPDVVADMKQMDSLILAGNFITAVPDSTELNLKHIHKLDLRMNQLDFSPQRQLISLETFGNVTHLDLRDNNVPFLDLRGLTALEFLNCQRNQTSLMQLSGGCLCYLNASKNCLQKVSIMPIPASLLHLDLSHNSLTSLPDWIGELRKMETLIANFNHLTSLPNRLFQNVSSLKLLVIDHNRLTMLPDKFGSKCQLETVVMHQNKLTYLPDRFLASCNRLRILNVSNNRLFSLPLPSSFTDHNRIHELYLAANHLQDDALEIITKYPRLKVLNLAYNDLHCIADSFFSALELVEELNLSGNKLTQLPETIGQLPQLQVLKLHSNRLRKLPDFSGCVSLRVLDIGANELERVSVNRIMGQNLKHLDVSFNKNLRIDHRQFEEMSNSEKQVTLVDMKENFCDTPSLDGLIPTISQSACWRVGFAQTSGNRNKLCISQLRLCNFNGSDTEALFGIFDGGFNNEIPSLLQESLPALLSHENKTRKTSGSQNIKFALLKAHIATGITGQKTGASAVVCHAVHHPDGSDTQIHVANVGHSETVLSRGGEPVLLSRKFLAADDAEECERIRSVDGIVTEDSLVNGSCTATRMVGCSYLFPAVIPEPHVVSLRLRPEDEFIVMANRALWDVMTYKEVVNEIRGVVNTILAAKKLVDLAQSYGARGNLSVIVICFGSPALSPDSAFSDAVLPPSPTEVTTKIPLEPTREEDSDDDFFPDEMRHVVSSSDKSSIYPRSASQILIMGEQIQVSRSAHSLTEAVEPEENYYFQHRRNSQGKALSSGSLSPDVSCERTVLTNGTDFEVHVSSTNARDLDLSGNTLSGHGDSALGSSVNPSVSDGNGSPDAQEASEEGRLTEEPQRSGAISYCDSKSHDDEAVHSSGPMDDEECRSWQFLMNEALGGHTEDEEDVLEETTLTEDSIKAETCESSVGSSVGSSVVEEKTDKVEAPASTIPPPPPTPPDPAWFATPGVKFRVKKGPQKLPCATVQPDDMKRNRPLIDELESVLKKRLSQMEEGIELDGKPQSTLPEPPPPLLPEESLIRQGKSSYKLLISQLNNNSPPAFIAQNHNPLSPVKRKL